MSANPEGVVQDESAGNLPPGALPGLTASPYRKGDWWYVNGRFIIGLLALAALVIGIWAASSVPVISTAHDYTLVVSPTEVGQSVYFAGGQVGNPNGGTLSGTFVSMNGTSVRFSMNFGDSLYESNSTEGAFHLTSSESSAVGVFNIESSAPATVYLNVTQSYLSPLI